MPILFLFSILCVKLNIFNSERMSVLRFDLGEYIQLLNVGTSFQLTLFSFWLINVLPSFRLHKSAWALPLFNKILVVCFAKSCVSMFFVELRTFSEIY
jgi:hypothetical protein